MTDIKRPTILMVLYDEAFYNQVSHELLPQNYEVYFAATVEEAEKMLQNDKKSFNGIFINPLSQIVGIADEYTNLLKFIKNGVLKEDAMTVFNLKLAGFNGQVARAFSNVIKKLS